MYVLISPKLQNEGRTDLHILIILYNIYKLNNYITQTVKLYNNEDDRFQFTMLYSYYIFQFEHHWLINCGQ